ncbi:TonB-dependent receptor [Paraglaciecola sp.]|uniref:TonB-dependent receptor n=1 Tax=Paraglaciecola sp. TaxID=1920173 RepID=UPI0030F38725
MRLNDLMQNMSLQIRLSKIASLVSFLVSIPAWSAISTSAPIEVNINASTLQQALISASSQMHISIYADFELIVDKYVRPLVGLYTPEEMLLALLANQGLSFQQQGDHFYVIMPLIQQPVPKTVDNTPVSATQNEAELIDNVIITGIRLWNEDNGLVRKKAWTGSNAYLSKEAINQSPSSSIADVLTILPSVVSYADMRFGQAATGESEYMSIRNLGSDYTATFINGMRVPGADQSSRSLSLKMISPSSLESVRILKTPSAEWGSENIGGAINIVTPNAFDVGSNFLRLLGGLNYSDLNQDRGFTSQGHTVNIELGDLWGKNESFGFYASAYHQQRYSAAESLEVGDYVAGQQSEENLSDLRLLTSGLKATDIRFDFYHSAIERTGGNFSLDYHSPLHNLYFRGNISRYNAIGYDIQTKLSRGLDTLYDNQGNFDPQGVQTSGYFQTRDFQEHLTTLQVGGESALREDLRLRYQIAKVQSTNKRPNYVESSLNSASRIGTFAADVSSPQSLTLSFDSPRTQQFLLSADSLRVRKFQGSNARSSNNSYDVKIDINYDMKSWFDEIQFGFNHSRSRRDHFDRALTSNDGGNYSIETPTGDIPDSNNPQGPNGVDLSGQYMSFMDGVFPLFRVYDRAYFEDTLIPLAYQDLFTQSGKPNPGAYTLDDYNRNTVIGAERNTGLYVQGEINWDKLKLVPGIRYELNTFKASHWDTTDPQHQFATVSNQGTNLLANLNVSYQYNAEWSFRFAARNAISRPAFGLLVNAESKEYDDLTDQVNQIARSNPELTAENAVNYDLGFEWYPNPNSILEITYYYKKIDNIVYLSEITEQQGNRTLTITQPQNGKWAQIHGVDFHVNYQFDQLPQFWNGFGVDMSATVQHSRAQNSLTRRDDTTAMPRAPNYNYKFQLFHQSNQLLVSANWLYTGKQLLSLSDSGLDKYLQANQRLDLSMSYRFESMSITLQFENLLNEPAFYKTLGSQKYYLGTQDAGGNGSFVQTGRVAKLCVTYQF